MQTALAGWRDIEPSPDLIGRIAAREALSNPRSDSFAKPRNKEIRRMVTYGLSTAFAIGGIALLTSISTTANADMGQVEQAINKAKSAQIEFYGAAKEGGKPELKGKIWYDRGNYRIEQPGKSPVILKQGVAWTFDSKKKSWSTEKLKAPSSLFNATRIFALQEPQSGQRVFTAVTVEGHLLTGTATAIQPFDSNGQVGKLASSEVVVNGSMLFSGTTNEGIRVEGVRWVEASEDQKVSFVASKNTLLPKAMATYKVDKKGNKVPTGFAKFTFNQAIPQDKFSTFRFEKLEGTTTSPKVKFGGKISN